MNGVLTIARLTFAEAARRKILLAALLLGLLFLLIYFLGFHFIMLDIERSRSGGVVNREIGNFLLLAGLYVVNFLTVMMTVLTSVDTISGEINSGTIHTLISKPIRRWELVAGKWLGFAGMLTLYLLMMAGGVMLIVRLRGGYSPLSWFDGLSLMWLNALMLLTISLLGGTRLSTLANGVLVFGLFGVSFIGGWIEQIGAVLPDPSTARTAMNIGVITSLIMPSEALWRRAAFEMQSPLLSAMGSLAPFTASASTPSTAMITYAVIYLGITFLAALRLFSRRDL